MAEKSIRNAIIFVGNTGVGKSYICNRIFEICGSSTRFESRDANLSVSKALQNGSINFDNRNFKVIDSPGFFDTTVNGEPGNDGINVCKLVKAIESCEEIYSLVYVYTDRFSIPHKLWFERMNNLLTEANRGNIVLLHNKLGEYSAESRALNAVEANQILGGGNRQAYFWFSFNANDNQVLSLLNMVTKFIPFQLSNLVIPDVCYEREVEDEPQTETIALATTDEGQFADQVKDTSHYEERDEWNKNNLLGLLGLEGPGAKYTYKVWVTSEAVEKIWVPKNVTRRTIETYVNLYKVRFDGTRDLFQRKSIETKQEIV